MRHGKTNNDLVIAFDGVKYYVKSKWITALNGVSMSLLSKATSGIIHTPMMYVIFGPPGVGKTSFAASFPSPLVADIENGSDRIKNATRLGADQLPDFTSLLALVNELLTTAHSYKTLIIDSVTALEKYVEAAVLVDEKVTSIKDVPWGGGDVKVREKLQTLVAKTKELQTKKGMEVIYVAHTQVKPFTDPHLNATYDRNVLQCGDKFSHILVSSADNVFFCKYNVSVVTEKGKSKSKSFGDGSRIMFTEQRPSFDAFFGKDPLKN